MSLQAKKLCFSYDDHTKVIEDLSLDIASGETIALVGKSGCGKSTLLKLLAGLYAPTSGNVHASLDSNEFANQNVSCFKKAFGIYRMKCISNQGFVFQEDQLLPWLSCEQNVAKPLTLQLRKGNQNLIKKKVQEALEAAEARELQHKLPQELSGGQRQRVAIARALAQSPKYLFLDEPLGSLDYFTRKQLMTTLYKITRDKGITTVFVTHNIDQAIVLADRIFVLSGQPANIQSTLTVPNGDIDYKFGLLSTHDGVRLQSEIEAAVSE